MGQTPSRPVVQNYRKGAYTIDQLEAVVNTGDLILFQGHGVGAFFIRWGTWSNYTHVAMVDRSVTADGTMEQVLLWESVRETDNCVCILKKCRHSGARLVTLRDKVQTYLDQSVSGEIQVCWVKMEYGTYPKERITQAAVRLQQFEDKVAGTGFESDPLVMARTQTELAWIAGSNRKDLSEFFCSELIAESYQRMGIMREFDSSTCTPKMFFNGYKFPFMYGIDLSQRPEHLMIVEDK